MKINHIMAILGLLFGIGGAIFAYGFSGLSAELATNGSITLFASLLGLIGIYLFDRDYKIAVVQYLVCGIGVLIGTSLVGLLGFVFYLLASILAYVEREKSNAATNTVFDDIHFYGNEHQIRQRYPNFPTSSAKNKMLWAIPIVTIALIILVGLAGDLSYQNDMNTKSQAIELSNVTSDLKVSFGYYTGGVQGTLTSTKDLSHVQVKGVWYSADGSQLDQTYDTSLISDVKADQKYKFDIPYFEDSSKVPAKVEIQVFENYSNEPLFTKTVNFN